MTKPVTRKMAVDCFLWLVQQEGVLVCARDGVPRWQFKCYICREPVLPGQAIQFDHIHGDAMGGPHEYQNLRPVHYDPCHKKKSKKDVGALAKVDRLTGVTKTKPKKKIKSAGFKGSRPFPKRKK